MVEKKIMQFRYYAEETKNPANKDFSRNYPVNNNKHKYNNINYDTLISGYVFNQATPMVQLGIQALPGTRFYLNGNTDPVIIGNTGIYEIDLQGQGVISALRFAAKSIDAIINNPSGYLIVDVIYEREVAD